MAALRIALGYRNSTPCNVIFDEAKLTTIQERAKVLGNLHIIRSLSRTNSLSCIRIVQYNTKFKKKKFKRKRLFHTCVENVRTLVGDNLYTMPKCDLFLYDYKNVTAPIPVKTDLGNALKMSQNPNLLFSHEIKNSKSIAIYLDASKYNNNLVGYACLCTDVNITKLKSLHIRLCASTYWKHLILL